MIRRLVRLGPGGDGHCATAVIAEGEHVLADMICDMMWQVQEGPMCLPRSHPLKVLLNQGPMCVTFSLLLPPWRQSSTPLPLLTNQSSVAASSASSAASLIQDGALTLVVLANSAMGLPTAQTDGSLRGNLRP